MFNNLFKKVEKVENECKQHPIFNPKKFAEDNPSIIWVKDNDASEITYNKETNSYEQHLIIPLCDENGKEVSDILLEKAIGKYSFSPLFCILSKDFLTKEDFNEIEFKKIKVDKLKEMIARLESL